MTISRREFLQFVGVSLTTYALDFLPHTTDLLQGRALAATNVYDLPGGSVIGRLWPDSVMPLLEPLDEYYRLPGGFTQKHDIQPMLPSTARLSTPKPPFWAKVNGPVAGIRAYADARLPVATRIGHGGVVQVTDMLQDDDGQRWYEVLVGDTPGWTGVDMWCPLENKQINSQSDRTLTLNQTTRTLRAQDGEAIMLETPVSISESLRQGQHTLYKAEPGGHTYAAHHGVPWVIQTTGNTALIGAYWHNRFGETHHEQGPVEMPPIAAEWLYNWLQNDDTFIIVS